MRWSILLLLAIPASAHADERTTTITIGGGVAIAGSEQGADEASEVAQALRLTLAWEHAPIAYPDHRATNFDAQLVPELLVAGFVHDDRAEGIIGAGLRGELRLAQREGGLLRITARGAFYVAVRGLVIGHDRDPGGELAFGEYIYIGGRTRLGFEFGALSRQYHVDQMTESKFTGVMQLYLGFAM
jgi:hypothetical protein